MVERRTTGRPATISDVAAVAKVDRSVVSRLLNDDPRLSIRETTRQRVLRAIESLGYRPNAAARSLRTARTRTLGLFMPDYTNPAYGEIIKGAEAAALEAGTVLMTGSRQAAGRGFAQYVEQLGTGRVDGLLLAAPGASEELLNRLDLPWLCVNRMGPGRRRYVILDDERASRLAVRHLAELGHTRLAHICGPRDSDSAGRRRRGYRNAVRTAGLTSTGIVSGDYTAEGGAAAMAEILETTERPTAVLVANVASAMGALHTARVRGVPVPAEISVIAVHDLVVGAYLDPPLTSVRMPLEGLGRRAVTLLLERGPTEDVRETIREPIELVIRDSTAPPPRM
jgi:LacI family transcriptional regulator